MCKTSCYGLPPLLLLWWMNEAEMSRLRWPILLALCFETLISNFGAERNLLLERPENDLRVVVVVDDDDFASSILNIALFCVGRNFIHDPQTLRVS